MKFVDGDAEKPLIIFVPGNSNLARMSYGSPDTNKKDFLAYWIHKKGYPFLAISYPLENSVFDKAYPAYTIKDWSQSVVEVAKRIIHKHHLSSNVIILSWSMGGELVQRIYSDSLKNNLNIKLFIGLSASAPLYNFLPEGEFFEKLKPTKMGLANTQPFFDFFVKMINAQSKLNKHTIISDKEYLSQFVGNCPIDIMGTSLRYQDGRFIHNLSDAIQDTGAVKVNDYPPIAIIHGDAFQDLSFTLFSEYDWGSLMMRYYYNLLQKCAYNDPSKMKKGISFIRGVPNKLVKTVDGTHFFFVGQYGAHKTVKEMINLLNQHDKLMTNIQELCRPVN